MTNLEEKNEILQYFPNASVSIIDNLPPTILEHILKLDKLSDQLKLCFVGRIHLIKNLQFLLEYTQRGKGEYYHFNSRARGR
ncbi:MAG: hypothetical protein IPP42_04650 [Saprospiraceae bacterium]|nr:hypothetical protein [Saprospiraceae bacterium]